MHWIRHIRLSQIIVLVFKLLYWCLLYPLLARLLG